MIFTLILVSFSAMVVFYVIKQKRMYREIENIPGPPLLPVIGNALELATNATDIYRKLHKLVKHYGPVVRLCFGLNVNILLTDPKYMVQVLSSPEVIERNYFYTIFENVLGGGLVLLSGSEWSRHRRLIGPTFRTAQLEKFMDIFNSSADELVRLFKQKSEVDNCLDASHNIHSFIINVICKNANISENTDFRDATENFLHLTLRRYFSPVKRLDFLYRFTNDYKIGCSYRKTMIDFAERVIAKRKEELADESAMLTMQPVLLDVLLNLHKEEAFTHEDTINEIKTFLTAGTDTVSATLSFAMFELARHPDVQMKLLEETNSVMGNDKGTNVTFADARHLIYTECVIKETIRMYTPAPIIMRTLTKKMNLGDLTIPAGANILMFMNGTLLSEANFTDSDKFYPDRFLPENIETLKPYSFVAFGAGPRSCIGRKFALLEAKVFLAKLIRNFELKPVQPEHKVVLTLGGTLKSENGLPILLRARNI